MSSTTLPAPSATALDWRLILDGDGRGSWNMSVDHALALELSGAVGVLRLYGWERPTLSFGRHEPVSGVYSPERARASGMDLVRRPTGGRAVLHDREVTYSVVVPQRAFGGARRAYGEINRMLLEALHEAGLQASLAKSNGAVPVDAGPCFDKPAAGEIMSEGRKIVGSAQARVGKALLQHGSIVLGPSRVSLSDALQHPERASAQPSAEDALPSGLGVSGVRSAVVANAARAWGGSWQRGALTAEETGVARELQFSRYEKTEWTLRR